jgi:hypothetical protein
MMTSRALLLLSMTALTLAACGEIREDLGLGRSPPDEFAVVERPPLSMPPDFGLRPPRPGAPRPQSVDTSEQASQVLFSGNLPPAASNASEGEKALLSAAGAGKADASIRDTVDREASQKVVASPHLVERLLGTDDGKKASPVVNAEAEAERIKRDKATNQPLNTGATPVIEKQQSGWLGL